MRNFQGYISRVNRSRGLDVKYGINFLNTWEKRRFSFKNDLKQILLQFLECEDFYVDLNTLIQKLPLLAE